MGFWQLFVFIHVIELKSFSEAAKVCHLSQPTVSSHIKQLESNLGCLLVDRVGRQAVATKAGEILYGYAKKLVALKDEAEAAISDFMGDLKGNIKIGASTIPGVYLFPEILADFRKRYPKIKVSLEIESSGAILNKTKEGLLELSIVGVQSDQNMIEQQPIVSDEMLLAIPKDHRWKKRDAISFNTLKNEPFIKREDSSGTWRTFKTCLVSAGYNADDLNVVAEVGHTNSIIAGIKTGLGVSILSSIAIAADQNSDSLKALKISAVNHKRDFYLTWNNQRTFSPIASLLKDFIQKKFS